MDNYCPALISAITLMQSWRFDLGMLTPAPDFDIFIIISDL